MKLARNYAAIFLITLVSACASLPTADGVNGKLALAITAVTSIRTTATTLLQERKISADDAQNAQDAANVGRTGIEVARTLSKVNLAAADAKISAVTTVLQATQTYLNARK